MRLDSVVCPGCSCLCDDISINIKDNRIESISNVCSLGETKFGSINKNRLESPRINGTEVDYEQAVDKAVEILSDAKKALVFGLGNVSYEAQHIALKIARKLHGVIDSSESICHNWVYRAMKNDSFRYGLLEDIRDYADLIIFWGCDPLNSHPRFLSKYAIYPHGRYTLRGLENRNVIIVDVAGTKIKSWKLRSILVKPNGDHIVLDTLRKLIKGEIVRDVDVADISKLRIMADLMKRASHSAIFFGHGLTATGKARENLRALFELSNETNTRVFPMKGHFNIMGAVQLLLRETGYPYGVDFADEKFVPGETTALDVLGEIDAALIAGSDPLTSFPAGKVEELSNARIITLDPFETPTVDISEVAFPVAITGIESTGIAYRTDGLPLKLEKIVDSDRLSDEYILRDIHQRL